jgi:hypothetical protein
MKFLNSQQIQPYESWKNNTNITIVSKNVKNSSTSNTKDYKCWDWNKNSIKEYNFKANPLKHYRKQYVQLDSNNNSGFSKSSVIGNLDKPGNNIVTNLSSVSTICNDINQYTHTYLPKNNDCTILSSDKFYDNSLNKVICTSLHPSSLIIKRASTVIDKKYSSSHKEYLNKKCKTFNQNLPYGTRNLSNTTNGTMNNCNMDKCKITYKPSNPVSSSTRILAAKYRELDNYVKPTPDEILNNSNLNSVTNNYGCCKAKMSYKRTNILS